MEQAHKEEQKPKLRKLFLSKEERDFVQSEWQVLNHLKNLLLQNINNYLIDTAYFRLKVPKNAKVIMAEDASYIEIEEETTDVKPEVKPEIKEDKNNG